MSIGALRTEADVLRFVEARLPDFETMIRQLQARDREGNGSPEGVVAAPVGATYRDRMGGAGTTFWVKESGTGPIGWAPK